MSLQNGERKNSVLSETQHGLEKLRKEKEKESKGHNGDRATETPSFNVPMPRAYTVVVRVENAAQGLHGDPDNG